MEKNFSEKYGFKKTREHLQINEVDKALRNRLWKKVKEYFLDKLDVEPGIEFFFNTEEKDYLFFDEMFEKFFKTYEKPPITLDELEHLLNQYFFKCKWYEVYDFLEYIVKNFHKKKIVSKLKREINKVLEEEMSAYRFTGEYIAPIVDEVEINEIEEVLYGKYDPVKRHLSNALRLLSDRKNPDYVNSIKESITAVEAMCQIITTPNVGLGKCLKKLKKMKLNFNEHFINGLSELYDWTNNEDGIRHAYTGKELVTSFEEAKFMLVICSAFINYLIAKYEK